MAARDNMEYDFLKDQFKDLREGQVRLENKLDLHRSGLSDEIKELREIVDVKIDSIEDKMHLQDKLIAKHGQYFQLASIILTTGLAGISGLLVWIWETLGGAPRGH